MKDFRLNNNITIPQLGFGTWQLEAKSAYQAVLTALKLGYNHIDTAALYANEKQVGQAVKTSGLDRSQLFITTKVWNDNHNYKAAYTSFKKSLQLLDFDYIDMLLIHWPVPVAGWQKANQDMWKAFEDIYDSGQTRAIGVSNFHKVHLESLLTTAKIKPAVNQIKIAPGVLQKQIVTDTRSLGIAVEAYSPLDKGVATSWAVLDKIAQKYNKTTAQVVLRWHIQKNYIVIPKASQPQHAKENLDIFDFELNNREISIIENIKSPDSKVPDPNSMLN
jgi:diketogulonate reductase-like aldo/keto reductase